MCPKAKADQVIVHRIEFQETERDALEMVAASITARNVTQSVNNLISPVLSASAAGVMAILGVIAYYETKSPSPFPDVDTGPMGILGAFTPWGDKVTPEEAQQRHTNFMAAWGQFRNAVSTELMKITRKDSI
jgi:hypothetical protein